MKMGTYVTAFLVRGFFRKLFYSFWRFPKIFLLIPETLVGLTTPSLDLLNLLDRSLGFKDIHC